MADVCVLFIGALSLMLFLGGGWLRGRGWMVVRLVQYLTVVQVAPHEWVMGPLGGC